MAIDSLRDGFVKICLDPSANIVGDKCRMVVEGQMIGSGTATPNVLQKVTSTRDLASLFGAGSVIAEGLRAAIECCGNGAVEIFALPRSNAGVSAEYEMTVTGPATTDGVIDIFMGDARYNISVSVSSGDTAAQIAAAIDAAIGADFPYSVADASGVLTFLARNGGTVGNHLAPQINWRGRENYMPAGVSIATAQTVVGSGGPAPLDYDAVLGECCVCCYVMLFEDDAWQKGVIAYLDKAWGCDTPQCFGHGYTYDSGTLGQILASDTNSATVSRLAHCAGDPVFPWLKTAAYAAQSCCLTVDNPEISVQGPNFGVLGCIRQPESCSSCFTFDEQNQLRDAGFVVTVPVSGGQGELTSPMVTNDITNNRYDATGKENLTFRDVSSRRLAVQTATAIAKQLQTFNGLGYFTKNTSIREGTRGTNSRMMLGQLRAWAKTQVGSLFSEFDNLDKDLTLTDDFDVAPRCLGTPGKLYLNLTYRPPVRIQKVIVNAAPKLLNNC